VLNRPRAAGSWKSEAWLGAAVGLVVSTAAALLSLHFGRIGYMPLDQSMIFDGGYRVLQGQLPFRDFVAPLGALPSLLQAGFFATFGTTWSVYCLHAAVVNGLFTLLVYGFVRLMGGGILSSWAWAAFSGVIFYPAVGTPLVEHHAFFFGLAALVAMLAAGRQHRPAAVVAWAAAGPALVAASFLSKPSVAPLVVPLLVLAVLRADRDLRPWLLLGTAVGIAGTLAITGMVMFVADIPWDRLAESLFEMPSALAQDRLPMVGDRARELEDAVLRTPLLTPLALLLGGGWLAAIETLRAWRRADGEPVWLDAWLSIGLFAAGICFALITFRSTWTSWGYLFAAAGGLHAIALRHLATRAIAARVLTVTVLLFGAHDAFRFHTMITATRFATILGLGFAPAPGEQVHLPEALAGLQWATPLYNGYPWQDLAGVVELFASAPGDFWLVGDSSILYALTGRPSLHPILWMQPPPARPPERQRRWNGEWERRLLLGLNQHRVRYVVLEHAATQMGMSLDTFPCVAEATRRALIDEQRIGAFTILRVRPRVWTQALRCNEAR
jgi:hypothetical protein